MNASARRAPRSPRTLPLRRWLVVALVLLVIIPVGVVGLSVHFLLSASGPPSSQFTADEELRDDVDRWHDPAWQEETRRRFAEDDISFVLFEDGQEFYRSAPDPLSRPVPADNDLSIDLVTIPGVDGEPDRSAFIYLPDEWNGGQRFWAVPPILLGTLLLTLSGIGWFLGRTVVGPLRETAAAARGVAEGNLDVSLPASRVREVSEVNRAFTGMSAALRDSLQHQAELEQQRRSFISAIVHDLRTPLFSLRGSLEGLEQGIADTPEKQARYLSIAREKGAALERLIGDLFDFTRLEYLDQTPRPEPMDLRGLLRAVSEGFQPRSEAKGVRLELILPDHPVPIVGDPHLLTRAIENVIDNALRYTPAGGAIQISCAIAGETATFSVADSGPGIPPDDLPRLFSPLFRGEASRNRSTGGAGLGLVIAQRTLRSHGGDITASNRLTGGAVFTGHLPLSRTLPTTPESARI